MSQRCKQGLITKESIATHKFNFWLHTLVSFYLTAYSASLNSYCEAGTEFLSNASLNVCPLTFINEALCLVTNAEQLK